MNPKHELSPPSVERNAEASGWVGLRIQEPLDVGVAARARTSRPTDNDSGLAIRRAKSISHLQGVDAVIDRKRNFDDPGFSDCDRLVVEIQRNRMAPPGGRRIGIHIEKETETCEKQGPSRRCIPSASLELEDDSVRSRGKHGFRNLESVMALPGNTSDRTAVRSIDVNLQTPAFTLCTRRRAFENEQPLPTDRQVDLEFATAPHQPDSATIGLRPQIAEQPGGWKTDNFGIRRIHGELDFRFGGLEPDGTGLKKRWGRLRVLIESPDEVDYGYGRKQETEKQRQRMEQLARFHHSTGRPRKSARIASRKAPTR